MTESKERISFKEDMKREFTRDNIKAIISGILPLIGFFYLYLQWMNLVSPILNEYSAIDGSTMNQHTLIIYLCIVAGFIAPLWFAFPSLSFGLWLGKALKFYRDNKTKYLWFDDHNYMIRDMPEQERKQVADLLSNYKSKTQLRKEKLTNESWLRRNFS